MGSLGWGDVSAFVFDCETTGVDPRNDRIVELGASYAFQWKQGPHFVQRLDPGIPIPEEAASVNGIRDADVKGKPRFADIAMRVVGHLRGERVPPGMPAGPPLVVAFNGARFDVPLLNAELVRANIGDVGAVDVASTLDPSVFVQYHLRRLQKRSLSAACEHFGIRVERAHSALGDVKATIELTAILVRNGWISGDVEEALIAQGRYAVLLENERKDYSHFFYVDRDDATVLRVGFGKHCGVRVENAPSDYFSYMLGKIKADEMPPRARKVMQDLAKGGGHR